MNFQKPHLVVMQNLVAVLMWLLDQTSPSEYIMVLVVEFV